MLDFIFCANNLTCHINGIFDQLSRPKYPRDVAPLCQYFEEQKSELPEYCKWGDEPKPPRKRSEF
jgi:uncharacterized protein YozE (UPF0346 family)